MKDCGGRKIVIKWLGGDKKIGGRVGVNRNKRKCVIGICVD